MSKPIFAVYILLTLLTFVYSYGFVDFNLTLSSNHYIYYFISQAQKLALFNRPLSTWVYLGLITLLFTIYYLATKSPTRNFPWKMIFILSTILVLSYPFLSSDVFKYLFSARTVIEYGANPHITPPQAFEGDLWLRFMRWIHTPSPYGPVQTLLAIPYYILGLGKFVPVLYLYKIDQIFWYALSIWSIAKLGGSVNAQLYFALSPLIMLEWLINAHNDAPMIALALFALVMLKSSRKLLATLILIASIGIKFVTLIFLPLLFLPKNLVEKYLIPLAVVALTLAPLAYHYNNQYQPWYVTWIIPFAALSTSNRLKWVIAGYSLGALLRYLPFIQTGLWQGTPTFFALLTFVPPLITYISYNCIHAAISQAQKN